MRPTNIFGPKRRDFHGETVKLCETAEALVQSNLFSGALEKILEPQDVQYIQAIVAKRVAGQELNPREEAYLSGIESDDVLLSKFNDIINTIEYISKKRGSEMSKSQDLPHFDNEGNGNAQKVLTWLQGKAFVATQNIAKEISLELQGYRAGWKNGIEGIEEEKKERMIATAEQLIAEGHFFFEQVAGMQGSVAVFNLPGQEAIRQYDASKELEGMSSGDLVHTNYRKYGARTDIQKNDVKLQAMRGDVDERKDGPVKEVMQGLRDNHGAKLAKKAEQASLFAGLANYHTTQHAGDTLSEEDANALWMYLTGHYGWYWLADYDTDDGARSKLLSHGDDRYFVRDSNGYSNAGFLVCL